jgi:hypothetical protein
LSYRFFDQSTILSASPSEVRRALCLLCQSIPHFIRQKLPDLKQFSIVCLRDPNPELDIFCKLLNSLSGDILPIDFINNLPIAQY